MKVSVSLPAEDIAFLDELAREQGYESRSAVLHRAVRLLRTAELGASYQAAFEEWDEGADRGPWETVASDGLGQ